MLDEVRRHTAGLQTRAILVASDRLIRDVATKYLPHGRGDAGVVHFDWAIQPIGFANVKRRIHQNGSDQARLVFRRDWRMPSLTKRQLDHALVANPSANIWVQKPLGEERRAKVGDPDA